MIAGVVIVVLLAVVGIVLVVQLRNKRPADIHGMNHPAAAHVQNAAYHGGQPHAQPGADAHVPANQDYFAPVAGQADIYDAEARARLVSVREQSSVTGAEIVYAIPTEAAVPGDGLYVDDGFYAAGGSGGVGGAGAPWAGGATRGGAYVDDGFYTTGGAGGNSAEIVYAVPVDTEA